MKASKLFTTFLLTVLVLGMTMIACKGPSGSEGLQGAEGQVGPAGEDGSMIYAGETPPGDNIGSAGDYYLNQTTGELYGPKESGEWGEPILVLMGQDGSDGEDGSEIYSGNGAPASILGDEGDYYLDKDNYELYGPKTDSGWGMPLDLKGAEGNANVTRYLFSGHDFSTIPYLARVPVENETEMKQSTWLVFLVGELPRSIIEEAYWPVPGYGMDGLTYYRSNYYFVGTPPNGQVLVRIIPETSGEVYERIEVVRIEMSNTEDMTSDIGKDVFIPGHLDIPSY